MILHTVIDIFICLLNRGEIVFEMHVNVNLRLKILVERHRLTSNSFQYSIYNQKISDLFADNLQQKVQINTTYTIKCCGLLFVLCFFPVFSFLVVEFHPLSAARFSSEYRLLELKHTTLKSVRKVNSYTILYLTIIIINIMYRHTQWILLNIFLLNTYPKSFVCDPRYNDKMPFAASRDQWREISLLSYF